MSLRDCLRILKTAIKAILLTLFMLWFQKLVLIELNKLDSKLRERVVMVGSLAWSTWLLELRSLLLMVRDVRGILKDAF